MLKSKGGSDKAEFWRSVLEEQRSSGLSIRAFCRRENLSEPSFFSWRKRLEGSSIATRGGQLQANDSDHPLGSFLPVEVSQSHALASGGSLLEITTPGGLTFRFGECTPTERLSELLSSVLEVERRSAAC